MVLNRSYVLKQMLHSRYRHNALLFVAFCKRLTMPTDAPDPKKRFTATLIVAVNEKYNNRNMGIKT
jgi:hypothetical protein